ncbi:MAG: hypothetical protein ACYS0I_13185 [Planctomycetota bacterium]
MTMDSQNIIRTFLFVAFFSIGAATLSGSILCDELVRYYQNRYLLQVTKETLRRLESLNADYDALLEQLQEEPNIVERLAPATLGTEPKDKETAYPKAKLEQLAAAKKALTDKASSKASEAEIPEWLKRCSRPSQRAILLLSGAFLILASFIWFGPAKENSGIGSQDKTGENMR